MMSMMAMLIESRVESVSMVVIVSMAVIWTTMIATMDAGGEEIDRVTPSTRPLGKVAEVRLRHGNRA